MFRLIMVSILVTLAGCVDQSRDVSETGSPVGPAVSESSASTDASANDGLVSESDTNPKREVLLNVGENIILPAYKALRDDAAVFSGDGNAITDYCNAIGTETEAEMRFQTKARLNDLVDSIQVVEMLLLGPLVANEGGLHHRIHPYIDFPLATCSLDQAVVSHTEGDYSIDIRASNQKGLPAIEYLLANPNLNHSCPAQVPATQGWNGLSEVERKRQRCNLAQTVAVDVADATASAFALWDPEDGNFLSEFTRDINTGTNFQALSDALFYVEKNTKSRKLTVPLGLDSDCSTVTCGALVESPYLERSLDNIAINLETFLLIYEGGADFGFDDIIEQAGFPDVNQRFRDQVIAARTNAENASVGLAEQVKTLADSGRSADCVNAFANPDAEDKSFSACNLAGLVKRVTDDLKIDFVTIIEVSIPGNVQSDND